jgi:hypothetical protein
MPAHTNYEDNIFYVTTLVKGLKAGLSLEIDPDLYKDKVVEDLLFVDAVLLKIFAALRANANLIRRADYLRSLMRAVRLFSDLLDALISGDLPFSDEVSGMEMKLRGLRSTQKKNLEEIREILDNLNAEDAEKEDIVSQEEYRFLLPDEEIGVEPED